MPPTGSPATIDAEFPGGNIVVESISHSRVDLHQDLRDTTTDWFYWCFRARGFAGREVTFRFTRSPAIGVRGPAVSLDAGESWNWLGAGSAGGNSFHYPFPDHAPEVRFSFAMPYQESHWRRFIREVRRKPGLVPGVLCTTPQGRPVELLRLKSRRAPLAKVLITCRHHCCEMMASYALEGLLRAVLTPAGAEARWLAENVEFLMVPFVDKDGVEAGDQGKNRRPHDHNRDYAGTSLYASVGALRQQVPRWAEGQLRVCLDLHCPYLAGDNNESVYLVGSAHEPVWHEQQLFSACLAELPNLALPFRAANNIAFGESWNVAANYRQGQCFAAWAAELPGVTLASSIEIPYANAQGSEVNARSAEAFGHNLATALARYLR